MTVGFSDTGRSNSEGSFDIDGSDSEGFSDTENSISLL